MDGIMKRVQRDTLTIRSARHLGGSVLLGMTIGFFSGCFLGCDLPDRHDIGIFRKPAVWEVADPSSMDRERTEPLDASGGSTVELEQHDTWHFWYLHQVDPTGVVGGVEMQSQRVSSVGAEDQVQVTLHDRVLVQSGIAENASASSPSTWLPNTFEYVTASDQTCWYALDGGLIRAESQFRIGPVKEHRTVEVIDNQIRFTVDGFSGSKSKDIPHQGKLSGPLAVYRSLLGHPLAANSQREATVMLPLQESIATLRIEGQPTALARRMTTQGIVMDSLREVIAVLSIDPSRQRQQYYWYDDEGVVQATNISGDARFTYRCDESQYTALGKEFLQREYPIVVHVPGKTIASGRLSLLGLDVEQSPQSLSSSVSTWPGITAAPRQYVQRIDASHQRVVMAGPSVSLAKFTGLSPRYDAPVKLTDLVETPVLNYGSEGVREVIQVAASMTAMSNQEKADELNRTVHSLLSFVPLSSGVRPAGVIAESSLADSTEHAILLIAMLRANKRPRPVGGGPALCPASGRRFRGERIAVRSRCRVQCAVARQSFCVSRVGDCTCGRWLDFAGSHDWRAHWAGVRDARHYRSVELGCKRVGHAFFGNLAIPANDRLGGRGRYVETKKTPQEKFPSSGALLWSRLFDAGLLVLFSERIH